MRKTGFSKEGRHSNPQIILGLLVSLGGYPLAYCIHEGNKYEGHTMLPTINEFVSKYGLENFVVVADSGLMNNANIAELEAHGYKYIIGAKIKNESQEVKNWILEQPKRDCQMVEYDKGGGRRLLVGYTDDRAKKDAYNREKGIRRLEKAYKHGALTKCNINKRGYNKFLSMDGEVKVTINYDRVADDSKWDGLKGYLTNTDIPIQDVYTAYHNLWHVERAFRIAKSKIEIEADNKLLYWSMIGEAGNVAYLSWNSIMCREMLQDTYKNRPDNINIYLNWAFGYLNEKPSGNVEDDIKKVPSLYEQIYLLFEEIAKRKAKYLIIDLRYNSGGSTPTVRPILYKIYGDKYLNYHFDTEMIKRISPLYLQKFGFNDIEEYNNSMGTALKLGDYIFASFGNLDKTKSLEQRREAIENGVEGFGTDFIKCKTYFRYSDFWTYTESF